MRTLCRSFLSTTRCISTQYLKENDCLLCLFNDYFINYNFVDRQENATLHTWIFNFGDFWGTRFTKSLRKYRWSPDSDNEYHCSVNDRTVLKDTWKAVKCATNSDSNESWKGRITLRIRFIETFTFRKEWVIDWGKSIKAVSIKKYIFWNKSKRDNQLLSC